MTPNEATIVAGIAGLVGSIFGALISFLTTRYLIKHGPNYKAQIATVNAMLDGRIAEVNTNLSARINEVNLTLGGLVQAHTDHFAQQAAFQADDVAKQAASRWRPEARIAIEKDATSLTNWLVLKAAESFSLLNVYVQSKTGATLAEVPLANGQVKTEFRIPIRHADILKVKQSENKGGLENGALGQISYRVARGGSTYDLHVPFTTEDQFVNNTLFIGLLG